MPFYSPHNAPSYDSLYGVETIARVFCHCLQVQALRPGLSGILRLAEEKAIRLEYKGGPVFIKRLGDDGNILVHISSSRDAWVKAGEFLQAGVANEL